MIGLIKLTAPNGAPFYVNPQYIQFMTGSSNAFADASNCDAKYLSPNSTYIVTGGMRMQFKESPKEIMEQLVKLRKQHESNALRLFKEKDKEPWQDGYYDDEEE